VREVTYRTKPTSTEDGKLVFTYSNAVVRKYSWGLDFPELPELRGQHRMALR